MVTHALISAVRKLRQEERRFESLLYIAPVSKEKLKIRVLD